ncbi:hypothetical protein F2Q69_00059490 [Brassica cretica]|uniref:Uncharacterized protein n=1 Tax=Brassica cretica TaxID=69181 RepID=A0A8S9RT20_BRACR|nr:hypothetical protein F2Q69_00059490 [Brassica cretica]
MPRMIRKTRQVMRFWPQIKAREEGWVFPKDIRKKYSGELCTRFAELPFSATNLGFFPQDIRKKYIDELASELWTFVGLLTDDFPRRRS